jgi:3',5'-cyclic AMP phosphodiesterase CpdA
VIAVRRLLAVVALGVAVVVAAAVPAGAQTETTPTKCTAYAVLKPGNEVREDDTDPVESRATGAALVHINGTRLTFTVAIANPRRETFIAGHIHVGARGVNGNVIVTLFDRMSDRRLFTQFDSIEITLARAAEICGDPAGHYVNYHTTQDPQGAVRGQLVPLP